MVFMMFWVFIPVLWAGTTVSGEVVVPDSDMGWKPDIEGMKVRVEGTEISADVDGNTGEFTITDVPAGAVTLLLVEDGQDVFTHSSKRLQGDVGPTPISGVSFDLVYHWHELAGYPPHWGETGYGEWTPHFVSDQTGFIMFRVRGEEIDPERMELYRTLNGGNTWKEIGHWEEPGAEGHPVYPKGNRNFYFSDQDHGVVLGRELHHMSSDNPNDGVFYTHDAGQNWSFFIFPLPPGSYCVGIQRFAQISPNHLIAAGTTGANVQGYNGRFYDAIWESTNYGATWDLKTYWEQRYGGCTGLGANPDGKAIAFFTPYSAGAPRERRVALRDTSGNWTVTQDDSIVTNSGYGPADVPMVGDTAWVSNYDGYGSYASLPGGLYQSSDAGLDWTKISDVAVQYMDFASLDKGFGLFGGKARISYDGGKTWLHQSNGGGSSCHLNNIWAFDTTHAVWHEGGAGDPNDKAQIFTYVEPWEANFELVSGVSIKDAYVGPGAVNVPIGSYKLLNHGPVPIVVNALDLSASGTGDDKVDVFGVNLWLDENANGYKDDSDTLLDSGSYADDDGSIHLSCGISLKQHVPVYLLVTYDFGSDLIQCETYSCSVRADNIQAETQDAETPIFPVAPPNYPLVSRQMTVGQIIFSDNLESGLGNWTPDPAYYPWQLTEDGCVSPTHSVYVWDNRNHDPYGGNNNLTLKQPLDLSKDGSYYLTFWHNYRLDQSFVLWVEVSTDGGANWNWVGRYGSYDHWDNYSTGDFVQEVLNLDDYAGQPEVLLRFRFDWTAGWYYYGVWFLDDIKVFYIPPHAPVPDIKANGSDGPVTISTSDTLSITTELDPGIYPGVPADWWCVADTPFGWYFYDDTGRWLRGFEVSYQGPLFTLTPPFEILNISDLPIGGYTFYFAVDNRNGNLDKPLYHDSINVNITP